MTLSDGLKYLMVIFAIAFIAWLFPRSIQPSYNCQVGERWRYDDLVSPFDFVVFKSDTEMARDRASILSGIYPFFTIDNELKAHTIAKLASVSSDLDPVTLDDGSIVDADRVSSVLGHIYELPIVSDVDRLAYPSDTLIKLVRDGEATVRRGADLVGLSDAKLILMDSLRQIGLPSQSSWVSVSQRHLVAQTSLDQDLYDKYVADALESLPRADGQVDKGQIIIKRGDLVTKEHVRQLDSYLDQYTDLVATKGDRWLSFTGYLLLTSLIIGVFLLYLQFHAPEVFAGYRSLAFMLMWPVLLSFLVTVVEDRSTLSAYMIPFCIAPIVVKNFYDDRLALFSHISIVLITSFLSKEGYEFTFLQLLAGIVAILTVHETRQWNAFFRALLFIFLTYVLGYIGLEMIQSGGIAGIRWEPIQYFIVSGLLTMLAYPLIPLVERIFGFTSSIRLAELADLDKPLLKRLSIEAPGTFQHSLQVANLCEAAAGRIGANGLLLKTAALYHDVGKLSDPTYFIENQRGHNPHDELSPLESAKKIIGHVVEGETLAKKQKLPTVLVNFIKTHHGTTRVAYFLSKYREAHPDQVIDEAEFCYPGPLPSSREEAILMLADSIEAASRSLVKPTGEDIAALVDKIIDGKLAQDQLVGADLSFKDLAACREVFKQMLSNIHHVRIAYPDKN